MMMSCSRTMAATVLMLGLSALSHAQTIDVRPTILYGNGGFGQGGEVPRIAAENGDPAPLGRHLHGPQPGAFAEFVVEAPTAGWYSIAMTLKQASDAHLQMAFETRAFPPDDFNQTRYATAQSKDYGKVTAYTNYPTIEDADNNALLVPLVRGSNILRLFDTTGRRFPRTDGYPADPTLKNVRAIPGGSVWSNLYVAAMSLTKVSDLPSMGVITGKVTSDVMPGYGVAKAMVFANPPGQSPAEPSWYWTKGWYTYTQPDGGYTLEAPLSNDPVELKAGRPSNYQMQGATVALSSVAANTTAADIVLPSLWKKNAADEWTVNIQAEYADSRTGWMAITLMDGAQNDIKVGYTNPGESINTLIDVPEAGYYELSSIYTNGGATGTLRVYTDFGTMTQDTQPSSGGWPKPATKVFAYPIYLRQGLQQVTWLLFSGASDFDALELRQLKDHPLTVGEVYGVVTNALDGKPLANATVRVVDGATVSTDAQGSYRAIVPERGTPYTIIVSHASGETTVESSINVTAGSNQEYNASLPTRVQAPLTWQQGRQWLVKTNTGGTADYSAPNADETGFTPMRVPYDLTNVQMNVPHDQYIWYRLHFDAPKEFNKVPGRLLRLRISGGGANVDDLDATWLNGQKIGQTGAFPSTPLEPQDPAYRNPAPGGRIIYYKGLQLANPHERVYSFPAELLQEHDNVLAIQVFQLAGGAGINGTPVLEVAPPTGVISGKLLVDGSGRPNVRVAAMNLANQTSATALTDEAGNFTLKTVAPGFTVIGAAGLRINAVTTTANVAAGATLENVVLNTTSLTDVAPVYDDFTATSPANPNWWTNLWEKVSLEKANTPTGYPNIYEPGYVAFQHPIFPESDEQIPGTITIESGANNRGALISSDNKRISRYASTTAARLVSAILPSGTSAQPNYVLRLVGYVPGTALSAYGLNHYVEIGIEGTTPQMGEFGFGEDHLFYRVFAHPTGLITQGAIDRETLVVNPSLPLDYTIVRLGSYFDFYMNDQYLGNWLHNSSLTVDHRMAMYSFATNALHTWDWAKAGPLAYAIPIPGDLSGNGILDVADAAKALRIWGGLDAATPAQVEIGNVAPDPGITILDALKLGRAVNGQPL